MLDFLSTFKIAPHAIRAYLSNKRHKRELLWDFVLDAIGLPESLSPDNHAPRTVSFLMIDLRIRLLQQREPDRARSEEHTSELQSRFDLVCRLLLENKKQTPLAVITVESNDTLE